MSRLNQVAHTLSYKPASFEFTAPYRSSDSSRSTLGDIITAAQNKDFDAALKHTRHYVDNHSFVPKKVGEVASKLEEMTFKRTGSEYRNGRFAETNEG